METNQERAFRFIYHVYEDYDSSYENLLENSKLPSLKIRRIKAIASETFEIIHKMYFCKHGIAQIQHMHVTLDRT